jgi:WD40 repeat protein/type 1 glutamine amidotransferase
VNGRVAVTAVVLIVLAGIEASAATEARPPSIEPTYPPTDDVRRPDRTLTDGATGPVRVIAYSTDGRLLAAASEDRIVRVWAARTGENDTGERLAILPAPDAAIRALAFGGPEGTTLLTLDDAGFVKTWDVAGARLLRQARPADHAAMSLLRPGPRTTVLGLHKGRLTEWPVDGGPSARLASGETRRPILALSADGTRLAAATKSGTLQVWNLESGAPIGTFEAGAPVLALAVSTSGVAAGTAGGAMRAWSLDHEHAPLDVAAKMGGTITALAFSTKGDQLAAGGEAGGITVWDVASGRPLCRQQGHVGPVLALAFSSNGQKMASGGADGTLRYWTVPLPPIPDDVLAKIEAALPEKAAAMPRHPRRLLVFWRADAILHKAGVPAANKAIEWMGRRTGAYTAEFTRDNEVFDPAVLARYDAIVFNSTAHLVLPEESMKKALLDYVAHGGGVVGIHAAIDMFKRWPEGAAVVGATFGGHPWHPAGTWGVHLEEPDHPLLRSWDGRDFKMHDELYELDAPYSRADRRVLMTVDLSDAATAGVTPLHREDRDFAVSWIQERGRGRAFYGMFGHLAEPFTDPRVLQYYLDGIQYALGDLDVPARPIENKAATIPTP